ncbi:serine/threonine protein kinase, partial [Nonomuraea turkmeniaca]
MDVQQRVGPYGLVRKLGEGGMGVVYLAEDSAGRRVALKTMRPELAAREEFRRRFGKEAEAARRVARFCTAPVLDAGFDGGTVYLVTEYVEGPDLSAVVRRAPLTGSNLDALAIGVATALAAIHQAGVVHRDLKPSNVLLSPVGPRVIDFGIAQLADTVTPVTIAQSMGTPAYMSPEQAKGEQVTQASDIFSWGALVAYAGTGRPPFGTGGAAEVVYRVINHVPVLDGLDERIRPLVERALEKDPARRPTAQGLMDQLLGRTEVPVAAATRMVSETWTPVVVGVLAAVLGAGVTLAVVRPWEERGSQPGTP